MTVSTPSSSLGRHVFGVAALAFGLITLAWHDYNDWDQLRYILDATSGPVFVYAAAAAQILGGVAIQLRRTAKTGAIVLGAVYLGLRLTLRATNRRRTAALRSLGQLLRAVLSRDRSGDRLCALVIGMGTENA